MPLSTRRNGPNELEWAWHLAGWPAVAKPFPKSDADAPPTPIRRLADTAAGENGKNLKLANLRVRGQAYCRKCGVCRCELHKHIQDWIGDGLEYCSIRQTFGPVAPADAKSFCYMSTPRDPRRCGRHRVFQRSKVVLQ